MRSSEALNRLSEIAREQAGYVTVAQAKRRGVDGHDMVRMAKLNQLRRVVQGVYALVGGFPGPREALIAYWLRLQGGRLPWEQEPPDAVVSHASAASLYGFGTFVAATLQFTARRRRYQPLDETIRVYVARLEPSDWRWLDLPDGIRISVTTSERTIVDLAYVGEDRQHVLDALAEARARGLVAEPELAAALHRRIIRRGRGSAMWLAPFIDAT